MPKLINFKTCRLALTTLLLPLLGLAQSPPPGMSARAAARILEQSTWGPTPASIQQLQTLGFEKWYAAQIAATPSTIPNTGVYVVAGNVAPLQVNFFQNTITGQDQLRQRVAFALSEIWVVSNQDLDTAAAFPPILKLFQADAFSNYLQLMHDITLNPAMGHYLDMVNNDKANTKTNTAANENYARELMQLFTIGLDELKMDGTPVLDSTGKPVPTYTQDTITNLARVLTGWTYAPLSSAVSKAHNPTNFALPMVATEANHDTTSKTIFGHQISAGNSAETDLADALQIIFNQPSLAPFISKQLIQHLVTSNPSPAYVQRVADVFASDATGQRGNLKSVIHQILTDPEARSGDLQPPTETFGHLREPVLLVANLLRGLNGSVATGSYVTYSATALGQNLFNSASVFSYFPPDYVTDGLVAPELNIDTTETAILRDDLVFQAAMNAKIDSNTLFDLSPFITAAGTTNQTSFFDLVNTLFFHQTLSPTTKSAMQTAMAAVKTPTDKAKAGLYIALTSSEYQVIH